MHTCNHICSCSNFNVFSLSLTQLYISDGVHACAALCQPHLDYLFSTGEVQRYGIIKIEAFVNVQLSDGTFVCVISDAQSVSSGRENKKIGAPTRYVPSAPAPNHDSSPYNLQEPPPPMGHNTFNQFTAPNPIQHATPPSNDPSSFQFL